MNILRATDGLTKKDLYDLSRNPETAKLSDYIGEVIEVDQYMIREDSLNGGDPVTVLSLKGTDGRLYATNSATARTEFEYILDLMDGERFSIKVVEGVSKAGRNYITLVLI